jgi:hypothetical protein
VVPRLGRALGVMLEAPLLLAAMIMAAHWTVRRFAVPEALNGRILMGLLALGMLAIAELARALWLPGLTLADYLSGFGTIAGTISLVIFLLFAAMPVLVGRARS